MRTNQTLQSFLLWICFRYIYQKMLLADWRWASYPGGCRATWQSLRPADPAWRGWNCGSCRSCCTGRHPRAASKQAKGGRSVELWMGKYICWPGNLIKIKKTNKQTSHQHQKRNCYPNCIFTTCKYFAHSPLWHSNDPEIHSFAALCLLTFTGVRLS